MCNTRCVKISSKFKYCNKFNHRTFEIFIIYSKDKDFSGGRHSVLMVGNCQPALVLTKEDIELHFNINMIGARGAARGWQAENRLQATDNKRVVQLI